MKRWSEMVLGGHPDKLCDQFVDALLAEAYKVDDDAYGQVEAGIWCDQIWLSGALALRSPLPRSVEDVIRAAGVAIGVEMGRYRFADHLCVYERDGREWTHHVNDQAIVIGWAGYDAKTRWLSPEHFLAHSFREALASFGPDGKLLIQIREVGTGLRAAWHLEMVLLTVQQPVGASFLGFCGEVLRAIAGAWEGVRQADDRWKTPWSDVETLVNPNGPLEGGGSDFDNGQTGRKLVMDYYGPRVPLGGGALSGKHLTHIDRLAAYNARRAAIHAVQTGASECLIQTCWAPNVPRPLEVSWRSRGRGNKLADQWFEFNAMRGRFPTSSIAQDLGRGTHFWGSTLPWNQSELEL